MKTNHFINRPSDMNVQIHELPQRAKFLPLWRLKFILLLALVVICGTTALAQTAQTPEALVVRASVAPVIDGMVDAVWNEANEYTISLPYRLETPTLGAPGETTWKALWNKEGIFVLVKVADDIFSPAYDKGEGWNYDKPELWFDINYERKDGLGPEVGNGHYCIAPAPVKDKTSGGQYFDFYPNTLSYSYNVTDPSYLVEYFIPFSMLLDKYGVQLDKTMQFGFDINIIDNDLQLQSRDRMVWSNVGAINENRYNMDDAGLMVLEHDVPYPAERITLTPGSITANKGTLQMNAVLYPEEVNYGDLLWTVINGTGKATINPTGLVTALSNGTVTVKVTTLDQPWLEATTTVTISGQTVIDNESWNTFNLIKNWNFDTDLTSWGGWIDGTPAGMIAPVVKDGVVSMTTGLSTDAWHYQLNQSGLKAEANVPYTLKFKSWSSASRSNKVDFEDVPENGYNRYGASTDPEAINGRSDWVYYTDTEPRWFTFHVTFDQMVPTTIQKIQWMLSTANATTYLDSVLLFKEGDSSVVNTDYLNLSASEINFEETEASATIILSSNTTWEVRSDQPWLTASLSTGKGYYPITFSAKANPTYSTRTATVTFYAASLDPQTIKVTQEARQGLPTDPGSPTYGENWSDEVWNYYNLIKNWNYTSGLVSWGGWVDTNVPGQTAPVVNNGIVSMTTGLSMDAWHYQHFQSGLKAEANVPYILKFKSWSSANRSNEVVFEDSPQNNYKRYGASTDPETANGRSNWVYTTTMEPRWFTFHVTFDQMVPTTEQKIQWMLSSANATTYLDSIILIKDGDSTSNHTDYLVLSANTLSLEETEASATFNITSNTDWEVRSDQTWLTVNPATGTGSQMITFTASANPVFINRSAKVTIYAASIDPQTITVIQNAKSGIPEEPGDSIVEIWSSEAWDSYNLIKNWNFTSDLYSSWGGWMDNNVPGQTPPVITNGVVSMTTGLSMDAWHYQHNQLDLKAEANVPYTLKFKSWSTANRSNSVDFEDDPENGYNRYGASTDLQSINGRSEWIYSTSTEPKWFTFHVVFDQMKANTLQKIQWMLSTANGTVYLDSVILIKDADLLLIKDADLVLSSTQVNIGAEQDSTLVNVTSNTNSMAISDQSWLTVNPPNVTGNQTITIATEANSSNKIRTATVTIYPAGMASKTITITQESTTGIDPILSDQPLMVYPNPTSGRVKLVFDQIPAEGTYLTVTDVTGRMILKQHIQSKEHWIDLEGNTPGVYLINTNLKSSKIQKIILK